MGKEIFKDKGSYLEFDLFEGVKIYFTTRNGGFSKGDFTSNNMAYQVGDIKNDVLANRKNLAKEIGSDFRDFIFANQVHGVNLVKVGTKDKGRGLENFEDGIKETDALYTYDNHLPIACFYADCTPIFLYDEKKKLICIIHAGWQGTVKNILEKTLITLKNDEGVSFEDLKIVFGPSIKKDSFVVKKDVLDLFEKEGYANGCLFISEDESANIDIVQYNLNILKKYGVLTKNIYISDIDTFLDKDMFSFRRDGVTGRMIGVIKKC